VSAEFTRALRESGAAPSDGSPLHFGDPAAELRASLESCALIDRSSLCRMLASGPDLLDLLHRLSTGDVKDLTEGQGRPTVLTSAKGRIVERLFVHHLGADGVLLVGRPEGGTRVLDHLTRYTFAEKTGLSEITDETVLLALTGPRAAAALGAVAPPPRRLQNQNARIAGVPVRTLGHDGLATDGFSVVAPRDRAAAVWRELTGAVLGVGGRPAGDQASEASRILRGVPAPGHELSGEHNPLEAGLREAISFDKGCYVGQEVVARLDTYDKVARTLVGLRFATDAAPAGTDLYHAGRRIGSVSSSVVPPGFCHGVGLAIVKHRGLADDALLALGSPEGETVTRVGLPFDEAR